MSETNEKNWITVQTKTFTKWMNNVLIKAGFEPVNDMVEDMSDGIPLIHLLFALKAGEIEYNRKPILRISKMENVSFAINLIKSKGIGLVNIGAEDIVDKNKKLVLGLIWTIISRMTTSQSLGSEIMSLKEELLRWVQKVTQSYDNVSIVNFTTSWKNGLGFNAIIHRFRPELVDYKNLIPEEGTKNCEHAFVISEENFGIPKLLDAEDVSDMIIPDEKSIITYISLFYQHFKSEEKEMERKAILSMFLKGFSLAISGKESYEKKAREALEMKNTLNKLVYDAADAINRSVVAIEEAKRLWINMSKSHVELRLLLNNIDDNHTLFNLRKYTTPVDLEIENFDIGAEMLRLDIIKLEKALENDGEIIEFENAKRKCVDALSTSDKAVQRIELEKTRGEISRIKMKDKRKMDALNIFEEFLKRKEENLSKFIEFEKYSVWLIESTRKLFQITDTKKNGYISIEECRKIVHALKLNTDDIPKLHKEKIDLEEMLKIVRCCNSLVIQSVKVERLFKELGNDNAVKIYEIFPNIDLKHLPINEKGELEFTALKNLFNN